MILALLLYNNKEQFICSFSRDLWAGREKSKDSALDGPNCRALSSQIAGQATLIGRQVVKNKQNLLNHRETNSDSLVPKTKMTYLSLKLVSEKSETIASNIMACCSIKISINWNEGPGCPVCVLYDGWA